MKKYVFFSLSLGLLAGCVDPYAPTPKPDYTIHVAATPNGDVAVPPKCPSWATATTDPYDNQPVPQFGCASTRNLALSVETPGDLLQGRALGPERGVNAVGTVRRYDNNQARGLIDPQSSVDSVVSTTTSPAPASALSGDATGGAPAAAAPSSTAAGP